MKVGLVSTVFLAMAVLVTVDVTRYVKMYSF